MGSGLVTPSLSLARPCLVIAFSKLTGVRISVARITLFPKRREQRLKAIGFDFVQGREQRRLLAPLETPFFETTQGKAQGDR